jgi:hypothetical protein
LICPEITLLMLMVQKKLKSEARVVKNSM